MKNVTFLYKKKLKGDRGEAVSIQQYAVFQTENGDKFVLFQLMNHQEQILTELEIEIVQYDDEGRRLKQSVYAFSKLNVKGKTVFVPETKIFLDPNCKIFECRVVHVSYASEETDEAPFQPPHFPTFVKRIKASQRGYLALFIPVFLSFILIYLISVNLRTFYATYKKQGIFEYTVDKNTVTITKYRGMARDVVIPETINDLPVTKIGDEAFKNSFIRSVRIEAQNLTIGDEAFANTVFLRKISGHHLSTVGENAFRNAFTLRTVRFDSIQHIKTGAFYNALFLGELDVETINRMDYRALYKSSIKAYTYRDGLEIYNHTLIHVDSDLQTLTITDKYEIQTIAPNALDNAKNTLKELVIDTKDINISPTVFNGMKIERLILHPELTLPAHALSPLRDTLEAIQLPILGPRLDEIFGGTPTRLTSVSIVGGGVVPQGYFGSCGTIREIQIDPSIQDVAEDAFYCPGLTRLTIPNLEKPLKAHGFFPSLEELTILEKEYKDTLVEGYIDGFQNLKTVTFPANITRTEPMVIQNAPILEEIAFPISIESINGPLIGEACYSLRRVVVPFIGYDVLTPMPYEDLNRSFAYTRELIVLKDTKISPETFANSYYLERLSFEGKISGELKGSFKPLDRLRYLSLNQSDIPYVGVLFTEENVNSTNDRSFWPNDLETVILNGKEVKRS
ncbi:MAG TPA: leucine-rich repeat protein [Haloplasmataceae bacterium]